MAHLFSPITIAGRTLRNRIVMAPSTSGYASLDGFIGDALYEYYLARAHGGVGLIVTETAYIIPPDTRNTRAHIGIHSDLFIPGLSRFVKALHGGKTTALVLLDAPASLAHLDTSTLQEAAETMIRAAWRAYVAGFDGVMLSSVDGGMLHQLISPLSNRRNDQYGGAITNRLRLALEIIEGIRQWLGPKFIVGFRLIAEEFVPNGLTLQDARLMAGRLAITGVNLLDVMTDSRNEIKIARFPGWRIPLASSVKRVVPDVPIIGSGLLGDPLLANSVIQDGSVDLVMLGRSLRSNPYWAHIARIVLESNTTPIPVSMLP
ncbi:MAG: NADH:flavin oxidoreductase [Chloroflexaceae bacterium]|nr:NADH:flavin oxidoreductase [Chloroflexaceae bacterium]